MIVCIDTSALVKRYVQEAGTAETLTYLAGTLEVGASSITIVEGIAAIGKCVRRGALSPPDGVTAIQRMEADWGFVRQVHVEDRVLQHARLYAQHHTLRGYDAVQLASAVVFQAEVGIPIEIAAFDVELRAACVAEGLNVWPPSLTLGLPSAPASP